MNILGYKVWLTMHPQTNAKQTLKTDKKNKVGEYILQQK